MATQVPMQGTMAMMPGMQMAQQVLFTKLC